MKPNIYHTANEWKQMGYLIKKGQKSHKRNNDNTAVFSQHQITKIVKYERIDERIDYTQDAEFWAKANPNALYWYMVDYPDKTISEKAGAILAKNLR